MTGNPITFPDSINYPDAIALLDRNVELTYTQLTGYARNAADDWGKKDFIANNILAIYAQSSIQYIITLLGCWMSGIITAPMSTRIPARALGNHLQSIQCQTLLSQYVMTDAAEVLFIHTTNTFSEQIITPTIIKLSPNQPLTLVHTSGSSSTPKAVQHTAGNHIYNALGSNRNIPLQPGDRWLLSLPLYHVGGLAVLFRCWLAGAAVAVPAAGQSLAEAIKELRPTHLSLVATQLQRLLDDPAMMPALRSAKAILLGGSAIPEQLIRRAVDAGLPIHSSYGSTEMTSQITTTPPNADVETLLTSGMLLPNRELKIADNGEIRVRGKTLFQEYRGHNIKSPHVDENGWFSTGDTGYLDAQGRLYVTGRLDNMFISGGENIQPEHIERALYKIPGVERAVVVPVPHPEFGERPVAFVKLADHSDAQIVRIKKALGNRLERFKIPHVFLPWPKDADTEAMKFDREWFKELAQKTLHTEKN